MPTQVDDASLFATKARSSRSSPIDTLISPTWPTSPFSFRNFAAAALRPPTATTSPRSASRLTIYRPMNPAPPRIATRFCLISAPQAPIAALSDALIFGNNERPRRVITLVRPRYLPAEISNGGTDPDDRSNSPTCAAFRAPGTGLILVRGAARPHLRRVRGDRGRSRRPATPIRWPPGRFERTHWQRPRRRRRDDGA